MSYKLQKKGAEIDKALQQKPLGAMSVDNEDVVCTLANTEYLIENHIASLLNSQFVLENNGSRLRNTGESSVFVMHGCYRFTPSDKNSTVTLRLKKNGVELSQTVFDFSNLESVQSNSKNYPIQLDTNDYLEVTVESSSSSNTVTVMNHYNTNEFSYYV